MPAALARCVAGLSTVPPCFQSGFEARADGARGYLDRVSHLPSPTPRCFLVAGRYAVRSKLGSGRTGTVYLADDQEAGRRVALKVMSEARPESSVEPVREEFRVLASLPPDQ